MYKNAQRQQFLYTRLLIESDGLFLVHKIAIISKTTEQVIKQDKTIPLSDIRIKGERSLVFSTSNAELHSLSVSLPQPRLGI